MQKKYIFKTAIYCSLSFMVAGCSTVNKGLVPIDNAVNGTKTMYHKATYSADEAIHNISNNIDDAKSGFYENSVIKFFSSDEAILKNREKHFVKWNGASSYDARSIIRQYLEKHKISNMKPENLPKAQKMRILKDYFFDILKNRYIENFKTKHKKVTYDKFLTDRENIEKIYEYKSALAESKHQWRLHLHKTQKKVAELMLSTLYSTPKAKFISYDPDDEEIYLLIFSTYSDFKQKVKFEVPRDTAKEMEKNQSSLKPRVYFRFIDNSLSLVGIAVSYKSKTYLAKLTDNTYVRQSSVVFTSDNLDLQAEDVSYTEVVKNIKPPKWYLQDKGDNVAYGQGMTQKEAKNDALNNIALNKKVIINAQTTANTTQNGSTVSNSFSVKNTQRVDHVVIKGATITKVEKVNGIWFVKMSY